MSSRHYFNKRRNSRLALDRTSLPSMMPSVYFMALPHHIQSTNKKALACRRELRLYLFGTELAAPVLPETVVMLRVPNSALAARLPFLIPVVVRPTSG